MGFDKQDLLDDNVRFLTELGYLSAISVKGPFNGYGVTDRINQFARRENLADVQVGDEAWTGAEYGKVVEVNEDNIHVQFVDTVKPAGVAVAGYNPSRIEIYGMNLNEEVEGTTQQNDWQRLASIGVIFTYSQNPGLGETTNPEIELVGVTPDPILDVTTEVSVELSEDLVSVQMMVNGDPVGEPVIGAMGISVFTGVTFEVDDVVTFVCTKAHHNVFTTEEMIVLVD